MEIGRTFEGFGRIATNNFGFAAVAIGVAAVAIWAIPGIKLTLAGAGVAALVTGITVQLLNEHSHRAKKHEHLTKAVSFLAGYGASNLLGATVGLLASAINTFAAYHLGRKIYDYMTS